MKLTSVLLHGMLANLFFGRPVEQEPPPPVVGAVAVVAPVAPEGDVVGAVAVVAPVAPEGRGGRGRGRGHGGRRGVHNLGGRARGFQQPAIVKERLRSKALANSRHQAENVVSSFVDAASLAEIVETFHGGADRIGQAAKKTFRVTLVAGSPVTIPVNAKTKTMAARARCQLSHIKAQASGVARWLYGMFRPAVAEPSPPPSRKFIQATNAFDDASMWVAGRAGGPAVAPLHNVEDPTRAESLKNMHGQVGCNTARSSTWSRMCSASSTTHEKKPHAYLDSAWCPHLRSYRPRIGLR
jgi:hypothetical protein